MPTDINSDQPIPIPLHDPERDRAPAQELMLARSAAIQGYANLEQSMSGLFAALLATDHEIAAIVFFRIVNARSRVAILHDLMKKRHGDTYMEFWNSVAKNIHTLDSKRNEIVHWHVAHNLSAAGSTFTLIPPNFWRASSSSAITPAELNEFWSKCDFMSRLLNMFYLTISGQMPTEHASPWLEIFRLPVVYPPPCTHPLYRK